MQINEGYVRDKNRVAITSNKVTMYKVDRNRVVFVSNSMAEVMIFEMRNFIAVVSVTYCADEDTPYFLFIKEVKSSKLKDTTFLDVVGKVSTKQANSRYFKSFDSAVHFVNGDVISEKESSLLKSRALELLALVDEGYFEE